MFIVWGKKPVFRSVGRVADYCPACRGTQAFRVRRIGMAGHVYYISVGEGDLVGHDKTCENCGSLSQADLRLYRSLATQPLPLPDLIQQTFPNLQEVWRERLALDEKLKHSPAELTTAERGDLIADAFLALSPKVQQRFAQTQLDKEVGFACAGMALMMFALPAIARVVTPSHEHDAFLLALSLGIVLVLWQFVTAGSRYMRREILPVLLQSLRPLRPTAAELEPVLAALKQHGHKIGSKLKLADVVQGLQPSTDA